MTNRSLLLTLQQQLEQQPSLSPELRTWLLEGLGAFTEAGGKITLCRCLGLRGPGVRHLETELARTERDIHLRVAFDSLDRHSDESTESLLNRMAKIIRRFEAMNWPRCRHMDEPPKHYDETLRAMFFAFRHGSNCSGVPASTRALRGIVV